MLIKIVLFIQCLFVCSLTYAQIDREFWFAAPDVYAATMDYDKPIVVRMTTFAAPATVTISIPANPAFTPIILNIPANATTSQDLTTWINQIENSAVNTPADKGLLIQSTADITAYYEVVSSYCVCNPEIFALKGKNALGTEFYISAQNTYAIDTVRHPGANASFDIVAPEDNTVITITPKNELIGHPAGVPFTITLNKGQTFSNVGKYRDKDNQLNGSYIASTKPIAVTLKGDLTFGDGSCADLIGDQTVPTNVLGNEYIVTKGYLMPADRIFVLAVEDGTSVFLDGSASPAAILAKGQTYSYSLNNNSSYIRTDKKVYVYQVTGNGCELGSAIIPKLNCTGSQSVSIVRSSNEPFAVMVTIKNGAQGSFIVNGNTSLITAANFTTVPGTGGNYVSARVDLSAAIATGAVVNVTNLAGKFSLGFINGTPVGGCRYGFFSDFKSSNVQKSQVEICDKDTTQLTAFGGVTYQWSPATGLSNTSIANPKAYPTTTTDYRVIITDANGCIDSAFVKVVVKSCIVDPCTNWLSLPSYQSYVDVGDLDIPGNTITVEATINRTAPWSGSNLYAGDVVSKHVDPTDANYLLRPNSAEITTSNGYYKTPDICTIDLNKTYHVAMTYDGATLKFYRDGFLMSQVAATGTLVQNNWHTQIGLYDALTQNTQFVGYINEVRIWNVVRSQAQIRQYMNTALPTPATQTGLQAYYTFDNLLNKQGNSAWNGTLGGSAALNGANPNCTFTPDSCKTALVQFTAPDTVCLNTPVNITNTSAGASTYYWNFCVADINQPPVAVNIGNPGNLATPVFLDYVYTNNNYYAFVTNYTTGNLVRLDFGNSLLNTPTSVNLGNYGGILQTNSVIEGIQVVQNEGNWYAIIVGGSANTGTQPRLVKIDFGANITSQGTATNWGNPGNFQQPIDLHMFKEGNNWYGFTVSSETNAIIRFNFTNSFNNTPTAVNLGNIGGLAYPTGIYSINDNGFWRIFITNGGDNRRDGTNSSITRLDFGNSLLNFPTAVNLGNPGGMLHHPRDLTIMKFCGQVIGFAVNGNPSYNNLVRLNFNNDLTTAPTITDLGNTGNYNFPHSISRLFRANDDVYAFITNVGNSTITRLRFPGCTNASVSSSTLKDPPPITYSTPGTYNINLTIDDGLPTQASTCKQVVVLAPPVHTPKQAVTICTGESIKIGTGVKNAKYTWNTGATTDSIIVNTAGTYWVQTDVFGCTNTDSMDVTIKPAPVVNLGADYSDCAVSNLVLDAGNAGSQYLWQDGTTAQTFTANGFGKYYVRVTNASGCVSSDTITITSKLTGIADFYYKQDICDPHTVQFFSVGSNLTSPYWNFGDGNTNTGNLNTSHTYAAYGNYTVKFGVQSGSCKDTITKNIAIDVIDSNIIYTPDTTICFNGTGQLRAASALSFCWSPTTYLNNTNIPNPVTSTPGAITYYYTAEVPGTNLVVNGDFSNGNTGFSSDYQYNSSGLNPAVYFVGTNPLAWNPGMPACHDHTTGAGNMLLVNGSQQINVKVWSQTVTVTPNTNYAFSAWLQHITTVNPAKLQFSINGNVIGNIFQANSTSCIWDQFYTAWNSGNNTTATISIVNQNTGFSGNDFALDDISFAPVMVLRDSVKVIIDTPIVKTNRDTAICKDGFVQLQATGAATWLWSPATGLSNAAISNPVATPTGNADYIVTGTTGNGCSAKDTVTITLYPAPAVISNHELTDCPNTPIQLAANPALTSWSWSPATTLNNPAIANPMATPGQNTQYLVQVTDVNNCNYTDSVNVQVLFADFRLLTLGGAICKGESVNLKASGGDSYLWSPTGSLNDAGISSPMATPDTSTLYSVHVTENTCNRDTTMKVLVVVNPSPTVTAEKTNDLDCVTHSTRLSATGSPGNAYLWSPVNGLDNPNTPSPVSTTDTTITYVVAAANQYGCVALDSVTVLVTSIGKVSFEVPNAFTPNGDGLNDCLGVKSWGGAVLEEFSIFNRWGQRVFSSTKTNPCWDGRYNGELQPSGGYVYVIRAKTYCGPIKRTGTVMLIR